MSELLEAVRTMGRQYTAICELIDERKKRLDTLKPEDRPLVELHLQSLYATRREMKARIRRLAEGFGIPTTPSGDSDAMNGTRSDV